MAPLLLGLLLSSAATRRVPSLKLLPSLARIEASGRSAGADDDYVVLASLGHPGEVALLNMIFGTSLPIAESGTLHADLCAPLSIGGPALACLSALDSTAPEDTEAILTAFAVADVWLATLPSDTIPDAPALDALLGKTLAVLSRITDCATSEPRKLLVLLPGMPGEGTDAESLGTRAELLWADQCRHALPSSHASDRVWPPLAHLLKLEVLQLPTANDARDEAGAQLLARFAQPGRTDYLPTHQRRVPAGVGLGELPVLLRGLLHRGSGGVGDGVQRAIQPPTTRAQESRALEGAEWEAIVRCEAAQRLALQRVSEAAATLREEQAEVWVHLLPPPLPPPHRHAGGPADR